MDLRHTLYVIIEAIDGSIIIIILFSVESLRNTLNTVVLNALI